MRMDSRTKEGNEIMISVIVCALLALLSLWLWYTLADNDPLYDIVFIVLNIWLAALVIVLGGL